MTSAGQSFLNLTYCKTTYKEFIKPYLLNATSPSPRYSTDVTTLLPEHTSLEQENYTLLCSQSLFFFCFAQFWWTEERKHEPSKIFAGHVFPVAKIKVSVQA